MINENVSGLLKASLVQDVAKARQQRPEVLKKTRRKKKDPNAPKRPKSAFMFFMIKNRAKIIASQELNPKKVTEVGKAVGAAWRNLSAQDRIEYDESAAADKKRYAVAVTDFKARNPVIKKPISAYMFFVQDVSPRLRAENPELDFSCLGRLMGSTWKNLRIQDKAPFQQKADADKVRYVAEIHNAPEQTAVPVSTQAQRI